MRVLFATTVLPHGQTSGGEIASAAFVQAIRDAGQEVTVFGYPRNSLTSLPGSVPMPARSIETRDAGLSSFTWLAGALATGRPYVCEKFRSPLYRDRLLRAAPADLLVIDHAQMGWLLPMTRRVAPRLVVIAHNDEAALYARQAEITCNPLKRALLRRDARLLGHLQIALARRADQVWTLSGTDKAVFDRLGTAKVHAMPLPARPVPAFYPVPQTADIGLLGTWSWDVNRAGLRWFIDEIYPRLPSHLRIHVAGRGSEMANGAGPNLRGLGFVEDPVHFLRSVGVLAVPTTAGSGIQLKTLDAIAVGTRLVSTPLGLRGIDAVPAFVASAQTAPEFARSLLAALAAPPVARSAATAWAEDRHRRFRAAISQSLSALSPTRQPALA